MLQVPFEWLEAIAQNSSDAIIVIDKERVIQYANAAAARMADAADPADIVGTSYDMHLSQSLVFDEEGKVPPQEWYPTYRAFAFGETTRDLVLEQVHHGHHFWLSISCVPLTTESGEVEHAVVYFRNISAQKQNADRLRFLVESAKSLSLTTDFITRLEERARLTVPVLADWCTVNVVSEDGSPSRTALVHRDKSKEELVEEFVSCLMREGDPDQGIMGVIRTGEAAFYPKVSPELLDGAGASMQLQAAARELGICSAMILPIFSRGSVVGVLSIAYAESGRRYAQEDLSFMREYCNHLGLLIDNARLFEEISKRDKAKDSFLATLSHELRNPMAPIKSALELLKLEAGKESEEEIRIIEHQFNHMTKLLGDLLDVSRYSRGLIKLERSPVSVRSIVERIVEVHEPYLKDKQIRLDVLMPQEELMVFGDATRLEQSITNIIHNAVKFTPKEGFISIGLRRDGDSAVVLVRDSGIGMDSEKLSSLFDLNAPDRASKEYGGLGIGLLLVHEIVKLHGGAVSVRSDGPGRGSEFTLSLPLTADAHG